MAAFLKFPYLELNPTENYKRKIKKTALRRLEIHGQLYKMFYTETKK